MNLAEQNLQTIRNRISSIMEQLKQHQESVESKDISTKSIEDAHGLSKELSDLFSALKHQEKVLSDSFKAELKAQLDAYGKKTTFKEYRATNVMYRNGTRIDIYTPYYLIKGTGNNKNTGAKPALALLGIHQSMSNGLSTYIAMLCSALSSYEEVRKLLLREGVKLCVESIVNISKEMSRLARLTQQAEKYSLQFNQAFTVIISMDGGRVRIRNKKRGRKTKKNRNRFKGAWREVKLFVIYVVDAEGNKIKTELPIIDGLIGSPQKVFDLLKQYLSSLKLEGCKNIVFVADGAPWIWNRANELIASLNLDNVNVYEVLDYFHAMEHLHQIAKQIHKNTKARKKWIRACKGLLHEGKVEEFIEKLKTDTKGKRGKKVKTERNYFINHQTRLIYKECTDNGLPQGSGAIESSIRRVVNLRMKGNSIYWKEESANSMLFLRSYYKAGRWSELEDMAYQGGLAIAA